MNISLLRVERKEFRWKMPFHVKIKLKEEICLERRFKFQIFQIHILLSLVYLIWKLILGKSLIDPLSAKKVQLLSQLLFSHNQHISHMTFTTEKFNWFGYRFWSIKFQVKNGLIDIGLSSLNCWFSVVVVQTRYVKEVVC